VNCEPSANSPLVSIVIPCYKHAKFLAEAIDSALAQTYPTVEVVVVNDGSPDNTAEVCRGYQGRIVYVDQENKGLAEARNAGIRASHGEFILPLDADDKLVQDAVAKLVPVLQSSGQIGFVYGHRFLFSNDTNGNRIDPRDWRTRDLNPQIIDSYIHHPDRVLEFTASDWNEEQMLIRNDVSSVILFRRADWERTGGYSTEFMRGLEDWDFYLCLVDLGRIGVCVHSPVFYYRMHQGDSMRSTMGSQYVRDSYRLLVKRHPKLFQRHALGVLDHWLQELDKQTLAAENYDKLYWEVRPGRLERYGMPIPLARLVRTIINALRR